MTGAISSSSSSAQSQAETTRAASRAAVEAAFGKTLEEIQAAAMYWRRDWDEMTERMIGLGFIERKQHSTNPTPAPTTTPPVEMTREELLAAREAALVSGTVSVSPQASASPQVASPASAMLMALEASLEPASAVDEAPAASPVAMPVSKEAALGAPKAQAEGKAGDLLASTAAQPTTKEVGAASETNAPPPASPEAIVQGEGLVSASSADTQPVAQTPQNPAAAGPLPSLSSLVSSSSPQQSSSSWIPPSSWYVSDEVYAVKLAATERYRQANLGTLQNTLFDEI